MTQGKGEFTMEYAAHKDGEEARPGVPGEGVRALGPELR